MHYYWLVFDQFDAYTCIKGSSHHQKLLGKKLKLNHLRVFESLSYAKICPVYIINLHHVVMMRYSLTEKGYK